MAKNPGLNVDWYPHALPSGTGVHLQTAVTVDGNAGKGTLYTPPGRTPHDTTVLVLMHPRVDFARHYLIPALVAAGTPSTSSRPATPGTISAWSTSRPCSTSAPDWSGW